MNNSIAIGGGNLETIVAGLKLGFVDGGGDLTIGFFDCWLDVGNGLIIGVFENDFELGFKWSGLGRVNKFGNQLEKAGAGLGFAFNNNLRVVIGGKIRFRKGGLNRVVFLGKGVEAKELVVTIAKSPMIVIKLIIICLNFFIKIPI